MTTDTSKRDRYLTATWNNRIAAGLGIPALAYSGFALTTSALTDKAAFIGMVIIGVVY